MMKEGEKEEKGDKESPYDKMMAGGAKEDEEEKGSPYDKMMSVMKAMMKGMGGESMIQQYILHNIEFIYSQS